MKSENSSEPASEWEQTLSLRLPFFGHRNWIVVADAAYPAHSKPGIETIVACEDHLQVARKVQSAIIGCAHIRANSYIDSEFRYVAADDAPGITNIREDLLQFFESANAKERAHEEIIAKLDECSELFRVLIIKTSMTIPYTSIFFELDCGYWHAAAEERLRESIRVKEFENIS